VSLTVSVLSIPSPPDGVWYIGFFPLRGYAVAIIIGIALAIWIGDRRWRARGGAQGVVADVAVWAVPFGIIGGRLYHVITSPAAYFGDGGHPLDAVKIWQGGLGIWGAVIFGGIGAWIGVRRRGIPLPPFGDAIAPGIAVAQAVGRWGNWFNQELFGGPTTLPWGVEIDLQHRPVQYLDVTTFHPTFLYESLWMLVVAGILVLVDRRWRFGHGRLFALYVALYAMGRLPIELLRIDAANEILGVRINVWVSVVVFVGAVAYLVVSWRRVPGRETPEELQGTVRQTSSGSTSPDDPEPAEQPKGSS
jgi:prolipoprotein diacylglyceryl transferase